MDSADRFAPNDALALDLLSATHSSAADAAHDMSHLLRVWANVKTIARTEGGDMQALTAATVLHDCVHVPKDSPQRASASRLAAERAAQELARLGWRSAEISAVAHAIEAHSFSAKVAPETLEAQILQDADRLDAIGYIGIARCFFVSGRLNRPLYDLDDPQAQNRALDDTQFAIDHFRTKLLTLAGSFQTRTGAQLAAERHRVTQAFLEGFEQDIAGN